VAIADGRLWTAGRGRGARLDGEDLQLADAPPGELLVLSTGFLDRLVTGGHAAIWQSLRQIGKIRNLGSQALHLCGVASGQFAAVASCEARIWDEAAAGLVVREAGGHWMSVADTVDWADPAGVMELEPQLSLAMHPFTSESIRLALDSLPHSKSDFSLGM
jgi:myo-inositol-1(or 4)-monophosphatase